MANNGVDTDVIIAKSLADFAPELQVALKKAALEEGAVDTFQLLKSIKANTFTKALTVNFNEYGRFVDMGVGRGVAVGAAGTTNFKKYRREDGKLKYYGRTPRKWYSKTAYGMLANLKGGIYRNLSDALKLDIKTV